MPLRKPFVKYLLPSLLCLGLWSGPAAAAQPSSHAPQTLEQTVDALQGVMDGNGLRRSMEQLDLLRQAGFSYQANLTVPEDVCPAEGDVTQAAVLSGMRGTDSAYLLFFGKKVADHGGDDALRRMLRPPLPETPLTDAERKTLEADPVSPASREIILRRAADFQKQLLAEARKNPECLHLFGAHMYGAMLENLYITCILVLAAGEADSLEPLQHVQAGSLERQSRILDILMRHHAVGAAQRMRERDAVITSVLTLLRKNGGRPSLRDMEKILEIVQPERARFLTPCGS